MDKNTKLIIASLTESLMHLTAKQSIILELLASKEEGEIKDKLLNSCRENQQIVENLRPHVSALKQ